MLGLAPLLVIAIVTSLEQTLVYLTVYFAVAWAAYFAVFVNPRASLTLGLGVALFTLIVGVPLGTLLVRNSPLSFADAMASEASGARRFVDLLLANGLNEELLKALPLWLVAFGLRRVHDPSDGVFYVAMSGLGFAAFEGYRAIALAGRARDGHADAGPHDGAAVLHATFSALNGYFVALEVGSPHRRAAICLLGLALTAAIHGTYDFAPGAARFFIEALAYLTLRWCLQRSSSRQERFRSSSCHEIRLQSPAAVASGHSGDR